MANLSSGSILSGSESARLRRYCYENTFTSNDLDEYAHLLQTGPFSAIVVDFNKRVESSGRGKAIDSSTGIRYGPTKIPLYNYVLQLTILNSPKRSLYLQCLRFFALEAKIPVDSADLSEIRHSCTRYLRSYTLTLKS